MSGLFEELRRRNAFWVAGLYPVIAWSLMPCHVFQAVLSHYLLQSKGAQ